jgi:hypothetical protein
MWIQAHRDPEKEWLQLQFCINAEEVEWAMRDLQHDWNIPVITKDMPKGKEVKVGSSKTSAGGSVVTKKSTQQGKPGQNIVPQNKGSAPKKDEQIGKKENSPVQEEQGRGDMTTQQTSSKTTQQETGPPK